MNEEQQRTFTKLIIETSHKRYRSVLASCCFLYKVPDWPRWAQGWITPHKLINSPFILSLFAYLFLKCRETLWITRLSYPNFVWVPLFDGMQPLVDRFEVLGTLCCTIREVLRHAGNQKEALLRNLKFRNMPEIKRKYCYAIREFP